MQSALRVLWLAAALTGGSTPILAQDDASPYGFRGDGSGLFPLATPPSEWGEKKNIKWLQTVGPGQSSPILAGKRILVVSEPGILHCLSRETGDGLWKADVGSDLPPDVKGMIRELPGQKERARETPVTDGKHVYVALGTGVVAAYTVEGARAWITYVDPAPLSYGPSASPILEGKILLVDSTRLLALDAETGKVLWKAAAAEPHYGTPVLLTLDGTRLAVTAKGAVIRISDGTVLAREVAAGLGGDQAPSPVVVGDTAFFAYHRCTAVKLALRDGKLRAEKLWEEELPGDIISSPIVRNGLLFVVASGSGEYRVLEAETGKTVLEKEIDLGPFFYPSLALAGQRLYLGNDKGSMLVLEPSREFKLVGKNELPEGSGASPAFHGPHLFLRGGENLYCVGP